MRDLLLMALVALSAAGTASAQFQKLDEESYPRLVAASKGHVVLVNFWATWCAPCREEMPRLVALAAKLKPKGLKLVTVSADEPESEGEAATFLDRSGAPSPRFLKRARDDDQFIRIVDSTWSGELPALILYDKSGRKVEAFYGETDVKALEAAIAKLL